MLTSDISTKITDNAAIDSDEMVKNCKKYVDSRKTCSCKQEMTATMKNVKCEIVLYNAKVVTVDAQFQIAQAVAIGNGKFIKVGDNSTIRALATSATREIDIKGKTILPGFIDAHAHMIHASAGRTRSVSLSGVRSIREVKARIAEAVKSAPAGKWIIATPIGDPPYFFNLPEVLEEKRWPNRWDLDEVSPENPVYIESFYCKVPNTAIMNSHALRLAQIMKDTPSEDRGVQVEKDVLTGEPNGQLHGMHVIYNTSPLFRRLMSLLPRPSQEDRVRDLKHQIDALNIPAGVTTVYEGHAVLPVEHLLPCKELWEKKKLKIRIFFAYEVDTTKSISEIESWMNSLVHATGRGFGDDLLKICGITVSLDGPISHGLALMKQPYLDPYGKPTTGKQLVSSDKLREIALLAARYNFRLNVCICGGDKAADITLDVIQAVDKEIPIKDRRWVVQHFNFPSQEHIRRCKELGLFVSCSTNFEWGFGKEIYYERFGKHFLDKPVPLRRWLDGGIPVAQSTDYGPHQPMFTLWQSLKRIHGQTGESYAGPDQKITREEALRIYTINGARLLFAEDKLGSIEVGKLADLVVVDRDLMKCDLDDIKEARVLMTVVGGKIVHQDGI